MNAELVNISSSSNVIRSRFRLYERILTEAGFAPYPISYASISIFLVICGWARLRSAPQVTAELKRAVDGGLSVSDEYRLGLLMSRLKRSGVFAATQKKALYFEMIFRLSSFIDRTTSWLCLFLATRRSESKCLVGYQMLGTAPPFGRIVVSYEYVPNVGLHLKASFADFRQKGGPDVAKVVRVKCTCRIATQSCLVCHPITRHVVSNIRFGAVDSGVLVKRMTKGFSSDSSNFSAHSFRIGAAAALTAAGVDATRVAQGLRWSSTAMVLRYTRNRGDNPQVSNNFDWLV